MNTITKINHRPTLSLPFAKDLRRHSEPAPAGTLSSHELKRIVANMVG
jgi:hypothetical protein